MATDDRTRDEKLQDHINKEAAEISALTSDKIDKYEYLTGKEILPCDQSRIIEQAKFTNSPLGKAIEKQAKTIKKQGRKQIEPIKKHVKQSVKYNAFSEKEKQSTPLDKQKEILYKLVAERTGEIEKLHITISANFQNLVYHLKVPPADRDVNDFIDADTLFSDIKSKKQYLKMYKNFKWDLNRN